MKEITENTYKIVRIEGYKRLFKIIKIFTKKQLLKGKLLGQKDVEVEDVLDNNKKLTFDYNLIKNNGKFKYGYDTKEEALVEFKKLDNFYK